MRFQMIDKILEIIPGEKIVGVKCISRSEDFLEHHFVGHPVMPGVLIIESMAQLSGYLLSKTKQLKGQYVFAILSIVEKAKFSNMARPGDQILITSRIDSAKKDSASVIASATIEGKRAVSAHMLFSFYSIQGKNEAEKRKMQYEMFQWIEEREIFQRKPEFL